MTPCHISLTDLTGKFWEMKNKDLVHLHFKKATVVALSTLENKKFKGERVECNYCYKEVSATTTRMNSHLQACLEYNQFLKQEVEVDASIQTVAVENKKKKEGDIRAYTMTMSKQKLEHIQYLFSKAIIRKGLPFNCFDSEEFDIAFKELHPCYRNASREKVSGDHLSHYFSDLHSKVVSKIIGNTAVSIITDGWTDVRRQGHQNVLVGSPLPFYYGRFSMEKLNESAENLAKCFQLYCSKICAEFLQNNCKLPSRFFLVTDSANVQRSFRKIADSLDVQNANNVSVRIPVFGLGCACHALNNHLKSIMKQESFKSVLDKAIQIVKYFRNHHKAMMFLKQAQQSRLKCTYVLNGMCETRFSSSYLLLMSLQRSKQAFAEFMTYFFTNEPNFNITLPENVSQPLSDATFWAKVELILHFINPIVHAISYLEGDFAPISGVYAVFSHLKQFYSLSNNLKAKIPSSELDNIRGDLEYQYSRIESPLHALAFMMDPLYEAIYKRKLFIGKIPLAENSCNGLGSILGESNTEVVQECLKEFSNWLQNRKNNNFVHQNKLMHPKILWGLIGDQYETLSSIAVDIFSCPSSSAAAERSFKTATRIHNKDRHATSAPKVSKQIGIIFNSQQLQRESFPTRSDKYTTFLMSDTFEFKRDEDHNFTSDEIEEINEEFSEFFFLT